ncbi:MAG: hypothetical protein Fur003_3970 [Candidatus Dojkabacteria bacterium]
MFYQIKGIHCESCIKLIQMELEEIGITELELSLDKGGIEIPEALLPQIEKIAEAVSKAGQYTLQTEKSTN